MRTKYTKNNQIRSYEVRDELDEFVLHFEHCLNCGNIPIEMHTKKIL